MLKLIIEDDEGRKTVVPFVRDEITIGRQEGNTIRLTERNVSRRHARLLRQSANVLIEDLGSYNGIRVNGDRITGQVQVQDGDLIQIGDYDLAIQREDEARPGMTVPMEAAKPSTASMTTTQRIPVPVAAAAAAAAAAATSAPVPEVRDEDIQEAPAEEVPKHQSTAVIRIDQVQASRPQRASLEIAQDEAPRLVVLNTDFAGREFPCSKTELRIGRTDDNDIAIDHRSLSRTHCKVVREDNGEWKVIDMESANGLMVNGEPYAQVTLKLGDVLELGHVKLKFVGAGEAVTLTASSNVTMESRQPSRGPVLAVAATVLVLVLGGGYALMRRGSSSTTTPPPAKPNPPEVVVQDPTPPRVAPPPAVDSEKLLADAKEAITRGDFITAEALLKQCKVDGSTCPAAQPVLAELANERLVYKFLDQAREALARGDHKTAGPLLESAKNTKFQKSAFDALQAERSRMIEKALEDANRNPPQVTPAPDPKAAIAARMVTLLTEGKAASKERKFGTAIEKLSECVKLDKKNYDCIVALASAYANRGAEDKNDADSVKAKEFYRLFLTVAPADDKRRQRVQGILAEANKPPN